MNFQLTTHQTWQSDQLKGWNKIGGQECLGTCKKQTGKHQVKLILIIQKDQDLFHHVVLPCTEFNSPLSYLVNWIQSIEERHMKHYHKFISDTNSTYHILQACQPHWRANQRQRILLLQYCSAQPRTFSVMQHKPASKTSLQYQPVTVTFQFIWIPSF
jgi:hypothetical protein